MAVEPVEVEYGFSMIRKKNIQVSRLQRDGFLLVKGDPEVWIQSNPADLLSVRFLELKSVEKIGDSIGQLSHLTHIFIYGENLKCLPSSISSLPNLQRLLLDDCLNLQELPENLGDLNSLTSLSLDYCPSIKSLPNSISKLSNLTSLHLLYCEPLKELPAISNVVELKLFGSGNIQSLPKGLCNLKKLHLFRCRSLTELPTDLNLLQLKIEYCCSIQSLPEDLTANLQQLHLPLCSKMLSLANLVYFRSLWHLTFDNDCSCGAHLKELPPSLWELSQLSTLNIQDTDIKWLPWSITKLSKLRLLSLPKHFRLETLPDHLKDSIVISVEDRHIRKTWQQLKTEIQLFSIPIAGLKETHSPSTPGYLQYRADGVFFIWAFNNMINIDNLYSLVRILDLDLQDREFDRNMINSIGKLPELTHLYISNGNFHNLPLPIARLAHFSLFGCDFMSCCDSLGKLSTLQSLTLIYCTNLPAHMDLPVSLTHFALASCKFDSLPDIYMASMRKLSNLKSLELFGYKSLELSLLDLNLTKLKITDCSIKSLPRCLRHLEIIHSRDFCFDPGSKHKSYFLDELQVCLSEVVDLETLCVTCYDIKGLPSIARHQTLQELQLKDCFNLRKLPSNLNESVKLCTLNVSGTRIQSLPRSITKLQNLRHLSIPKCFTRKCLPKNFEDNVRVFDDDTDDIYYQHSGYYDSDFDSSEDDKITLGCTEGGDEEVSQESTHDSVIKQTSSHSLLKPLHDATQVHEDSSVNGLTDAVDESSFNALCNVPIEGKEILSIRNSESNQLVGRMGMEIEQRSAEYDFTNSVQGGCDGHALDIEQNHNPLSDNVKDSKTQKKEILLERILELRSQNMRLVDAAEKELEVSRSTLKRRLKDYGLIWPSSRKRKQHLDAKSKKQNTKSTCGGKNSSLLNLVGPANLSGHDHGVEHLDGLNQLTLTDEVPSESMVKIVVQPPMATQCQMDGHPPVKEHSNNAEECRFLCTAQQPNESSSTFVVKATYNEDTVRFNFSVSSSVEQLKEEVGESLELEVGKFKINYQDEDKEWMLMTRVSDMEHALNVSKSSGSSVVRLSVLPSGFEYVGNPRLRSQSTARSSQRRLATNASVSTTSCMDVDEDSFPYYHDLPSKILPYIVGWNDVVGDGHCGFRCVADAYHGDENEWQLVRNHLANEIHRHPDKYAAVYFRELEAAIHRIDYYGSHADKSHWMEVNNDLFTIANVYKCAVHFYTLLPNNVLFGCCTVLPWQAPSTVRAPRSEVAIALIQRSRHFIRLHLSENYPVPPIAELWNDYRTKSVAEWPKLYAARLKHWNSIVD